MTSKRHEFVFASGNRRPPHRSEGAAEAARKTFGNIIYTARSQVPIKGHSEPVERR
jgi:hypothetical protein